MGVFRVPIEVGDPTGQSFESLEATVDTGATNTVLPRTLLNRLGVTPHTKGRFRVADGRHIELDIGRTWVRVDGQQEFTQVAFGVDESRAILGAVTLEEMSLSVDPIGKRLVPVDKYLL
jgi:aspartyl protease family protein